MLHRHHLSLQQATTEPHKLSWLQSTNRTMPTSPLPLGHKPVELIDWPLLALLDHHGPCALKELMSETDSNIDVGEISQSLNKEVCSLTTPVVIFISLIGS